MAKHVILESYTFTPSTKTIVVTGKTIKQEQLLLITNVTRGTVIYNFSDPNLGLVSLSNAIETISGTETATMVVNYNTTAMSSTDKISILYEETYESFQPAETFFDPVGKMRVSQPQALIDTDFEYGTQPTKWESIHLMNNRPSVFFDATTPYTLSAMTSGGARTITVTGSGLTGLTAGTSIMYIVDSLNPAANGFFVIDSQNGSTQITYTAKTTVAAGSIFDPTRTYMYPCQIFTGAGIPCSSMSIVSGVTILVNCTFAHGLTAGDAIFVTGTTISSSNPPNGSWIVKTVPTSNTFTFDMVNTPSGTITLSAGATASLYPRPWGFVSHRPFDGGVQFSTGLPYPGNQVIRQTRRYFRYQSGKGMQFSTGSMFKPVFQVDNVTSSGSVVTVTCKQPHNINVGANIRVSGCNETAYNGIYIVASITDELTFTYNAFSTPSATPATGFPITVGPWTWFGSAVRVGMFDNQNGFFFEFDGQTLFACRRSSTDQLSGRCSAANGSQAINGVGTRFSTQLRPFDNIVIRGMSYTVINIASDTSMHIYPEYRGTSIDTGCIISKTTDVKIPQSQWNIDRLDGTGASTFSIDLTRMQMWYMDYSWYGAGAIRFGVKNQRGEVIYCHRIANANLRTEAYMRSGNLPSRYECNTSVFSSVLTTTLPSGSTSGLTLADTTYWPNTGTVILTAGGSTATNNVVEYINYTSKTGNTLNGLTRNVTNLSGPGGFSSGGGTSTATTFTTSTTIPISVALWAPSVAATISHWGSSVIMDGRYDDDKSLIFVAGMTTAINNIGAGVTQPLISIRVAPAVDSGITGLLGAREIINRMQLTLRTMAAFSTGSSMSFFVSLRLNGRVSGGTFASAGGSSLAQVAFHTSGQTITGGENVYGFFTTTPGTTDQDLTLVRDLGNSILGGGNTLNVPTGFQNLYPDGPDIITVCATNVTAVTTNSINARINWTEAQA
jgi:hypothetical protein